jgi:hypothetical protein
MGRRAIKRKVPGFGKRGTEGVTVPREGSWAIHWVDRWHKLLRKGGPARTRVKKGFGFKRS